MAMLAGDAFGMELHAEDRQRAVAHPHQQPVLGPCRRHQHLGQRAAINGEAAVHTSESGGPECLANRLDAIAAGLRPAAAARRAGTDRSVESNRREVVRRLSELQQIADVALGALTPGRPCFSDVADHVRMGLADVRATLSAMRSQPCA